MIAFNYNILFIDEPQLNNINFNDTLETIPVKQHTHNISLKTFSQKTDYIDLSGRSARYVGSSPVSEVKRGVSWALEVKEVLTLIWNADRREITYIKGDQYTSEHLRFWVLHTFLPFILDLERSYHILHVGSVEIKGRPVLFSAPSFGGKSTMTDYFIQKGHMMLSDDSLAIDKRGDEYYAIASYPFHRPYRKVEELGYPVKNFATKSKPLHAVYLLEKSEPDARVEISELRGIEKFKAFHYSTFIDFSFMKQERFAFFTEMSKHIPVYKVKVPWDMERLNEVYEKIVKHSVL